MIFLTHCPSSLTINEWLDKVQINSSQVINIETMFIDNSVFYQIWYRELKGD